MRRLLIVPGILLLFMTQGFSGNPIMAEEAISTGMGRVVFYRTSKMGGAAIPVNVSHASGVIGTLRNGSTFSRDFEPGLHTFWVKVIAEDSVTVNVEAGKTSFVRGTTSMGVVVARPKLTLVDESEARAALAKLK